ncbi:hypothetical protein LV82_00184 [Albidovulum inexpectatum]|uniref:Probable membrane transporter protein n=1 Tax=Albidovulum inexpectatum TaxID=196587 RepID=A0A2S5JLI5_9RHOB|nr:sulfite exporter TauE/SafE family protein [Albidovulum inexpectatum]PPB82258.1 hypothetical protein LV82_00184 [Albidovulum inexpectatum]
MYLPEIWILVAAGGVALFAGVVKGAVGFAMPMIMISGLASFLPAEQALAGLILPALVTNLIQALRQGLSAAWGTVRDYRALLIVLCGTIVVAAQLVPILPQAVMLLLLGVPIVAFALSQLAGLQLRIPARRGGRAEIMAGLVGGFFGGIAGVWGPPVIALLISRAADKRESVRVQGVVYLLGSVMLLAAHLRSGVANATTLPLSVVLTVPACLGMWLGFALQDRLDAERFRKWTLIVLALTGVNLIRRALTF